MQLQVEAEGETKAVSIDLDEPLTLSQTRRVFELCGSVDPLRDLATGKWDPDAARAMVFVKLESLIPEIGLEWDSFSVDFGIPDAELEAELPVEDL